MTFGILGPGSGFSPLGDLTPDIRRIGRPVPIPGAPNAPPQSATQSGLAGALANLGPNPSIQQIIAAVLSSGGALGGGGGRLGGGGLGFGSREPGSRGDFGMRRAGLPVGSERIDMGFPTNAALGALLGGPIGAFGGFVRDVATAPRTRSLTDRQARDIQSRAEREDRQANRDLREGRGSGAGPRRGAENAGNRGR